MRSLLDRIHLTAILVAVVTMTGITATTGHGQEQRVPTAADFADIRELDDVRISPDAAWIATVIRDQADTTGGAGRGERAVYVMPADGSASPRRIGAELGAADHPRWAPDGRALGFLAPGEGGGRQIHVYRIDDAQRHVVQLTSGPPVSAYAWSPSGSELAFLAPVPRTAGAGATTGLWLLDIATGSTAPLTPPGVAVRDLAWSPAGDAVAVIVSGGGEESSVSVVQLDGSMRTLAGNAGGPGTRRQVLDWSPDGRTVLFARTGRGGEVGQWLGLVPSAGGPVRELLRDYEGTVMRAVWDPSGRGIIAQSFEGLLSRLLRIDAATGDRSRLADVMDAYPSFSVSDDGRTIAFRSDRLDGPADVWILGDGSPARRISHLNPRFDELALGPVRPFEWTNAEDGTRLEGVLVLPPDHNVDAAYPTIVQLHGGPHFHWGLGWLGTWHHWAQLLASRGYVVFLPNPRGSTGRGAEFASAIIHDIGGIDYHDVMTGVDALVAAGIADPDRLGVGGWSYGGFLTARTITQTDRFKAAVVGAGISNLFSFAGTPGLGRGWARSFFPDHPYAVRERFEDRSATTHLHKVKSATLVVHGERDAKISVTQAWELHYGLQYLGITTDILIFPRAGHGLTDRNDRITYLTSVLAWFDRHVRDGADRTIVTSEAGGL